MNRRDREARLLEVMYGWGVAELIEATSQGTDLEIQAALHHAEVSDDYDFITYFSTRPENKDDDCTGDKTHSPAKDVSRLKNYISEVKETADSLRQMTSQEFAVAYSKTIENENSNSARFMESHGALEDENDFFNEPDAAFGLDTWMKKEFWSAEEAVAISLSKNPDKVNLSLLSPMTRVTGSPFRKLFQNRLDAIQRAIKGGTLTEHMHPSRFWAWAKNQSAFGDSEINQISAFVSDDSIHGNTLHTLYRIILNVATQKYGLDAVTPSRNNLLSVAADMAITNRDQVMFDLTSKTIERHLKDAQRWAFGEGLLRAPPAPIPKREKSSKKS